VNYTYDGDGKRVEKSPGKLYWYGSSGEVLDETDLSGNLTSEYISFGGYRIARRDSPSNSIYYYFGDQLGTSREIVQSGQTTACYEGDFYPFGGERIITNTCPQNYKFTGKERDTESGNDYFKYRYYSSSMGRWMSPDPSQLAHADPRNPQSLNLYAYVGNNPLDRVDLDGLCWQLIQKACDLITDFGQSINNAVHGYGFHTDNTVDRNVEEANRLLRSRGVNTEGLTWKQRLKAAHEPKLDETIALDVFGLSGIFVHVPLKVGVVGAVVGIANEPTYKNVATQLIGLSEPEAGPMAITGTFNDIFDYGANNSTGSPTDTWKGAPIFDTGDNAPSTPPPPVLTRQEAAFPKDASKQASVDIFKLISTCAPPFNAAQAWPSCFFVPDRLKII
jgi:RHS repeat-associated protein